MKQSAVVHEITQQLIGLTIVKLPSENFSQADGSICFYVIFR